MFEGKDSASDRAHQSLLGSNALIPEASIGPNCFEKNLNLDLTYVAFGYKLLLQIFEKNLSILAVNILSCCTL